jgi:hypothetical protein
MSANGSTTRPGLDAALATDGRFLRAILLGAAVGIPATWLALTAVFWATTSFDWLDVAGFSALPAFFCGPFLGGLFTTARAHSETEHSAHEETPEIENIPRAA